MNKTMQWRTTCALLFIAALLQRSECGPPRTKELDHSAIFVDFFNKGLTSIPKHLDPDTTHLNLIQNRITSVQNLKNCSQLLYLNLRSNFLATTDDLRGIRWAKKLKFLDLSDNGLLTFNPNIFQQNTKLEVLILDGNPDLTIDGRLPNLPCLQKLSLVNCSFTSMPWSDFQHAPRLEILDIRGNFIKEIPEEVTRSLPDSVQLMVDDDLCRVLKNSADVTEKKIELFCREMPEAVEEVVTKDVVVEGKSLHGKSYDWTIVVLVIMVVCITVVALYLYRRIFF